jgi:hypothetical protein
MRLRNRLILVNGVSLVYFAICAHYTKDLTSELIGDALFLTFLNWIVLHQRGGNQEQ